MAYGYIKTAYGLTFKVGDRVKLERSGRVGTVSREKPSAGHYVQVRFDGHQFSMPCHPQSLEFFLKDPAHD